jgi:4-hydroxybenzoate polyprenyltransferase
LGAAPEAASESFMREHVPPSTAAPGFGTRWRTYFRERFPLPLQAPAIAVFTSSVYLYAQAVQGASAAPSLPGLAIAFGVVLLAFLQLRILDEFKDFDEDRRFRPYRPVPRGLVTLRGLGWLGGFAACVQAAASALVGARALAVLAVVWAYAALMGVEFFARSWLRARPLLYMASHMAIVPLLVAYVATCADALAPAAGLLWLAAMSYLSFAVFEIGRKIRAPADEAEGVETYSALWGLRPAVLAWLGTMAGAGAFAVLAARDVDAVPAAAALAAAVLAVAAGVARRFLADPRPGRGKTFFAVSGAWLVATYLALGAGAWTQLHRLP